MKTIIVSDTEELFDFLPDHIEKINAFDYLSNPNIVNDKPTRIINLCKSFHYQSIGYYVSLLAEAHQHKAIPSVMTIQDTSKSFLAATISEDIDEDIQACLYPIKSKEFALSVYFGKNMAKRYETLARKLHGLFSLPLFRVHFKHTHTWKITKIHHINLDDINESHYDFLRQSAQDYFSKKRFRNYRKKTWHYDLAILQNPKEETPPSNKKALEKFIHAGETLGINIDLIDKTAYKNIAEYDGLFIRETTAVNHYTYNFARKATSENMVVIDDPLSILRCTNKVYLAELMQQNNIAAPKTWVLSKQNWKELSNQLKFPCVLKLPDSSFSKGVVKVLDASELKSQLKQFFKSSELIIAQEYFYTDYDWRIGIIDNIPLFACQYFMANGHWQIYNWKDSADTNGDFKCIDINDVPAPVLKAAKKISGLIGDGFYGVDVKQRNNKAYIIEINDNPNIDAGIEDSILGDELYLIIMRVFLQRMRRRHGYE